MKQLIFSTIIAMLPFAAIAQDDLAMLTGNEYIYVSGTYFETPPAHSVWSNATGNSSTHAAYTNYDGVTYVTLTSYGKQVEVELRYDVKVKKGELTMVVLNEKNEVVFSKAFRESERKIINVTLEPFEPYQIKFIGKNTKGSYYCEWAEL